MGRYVGIDLGTTYSAVAAVNALGKPEIILNRDGESITPSVVQFQGEVPLVGTMAKRSAAMAPFDTVQFVKRHIGNPSWVFDTADGTSYRAEEISAIILKRLKEDAEDAFGEPVTDAVITVPAYFDDGARRATKDAGRFAGFEVHRVLNEPTAAALAYGVDGASDGTVLVYDLGGGTFDVTVMRIAEGEFEILATKGDRNLGGFDWDNRLMELVNERFRAAGGPDLLDDEVTEIDLRDKAELVKRALTTVAKTRVTLSAGGVTSQVEVTRSEFEHATAGLLSRTRDIAEIVLEDAGIDWAKVDNLLLAGGSTRMPAVRSLMEAAAGMRAERGFNPDEVVALGAAVQAHLVECESGGSGAGAVVPLEIRDVTSHGLGTVILDTATNTSVNSIIIPANTKIPSKKGQTYFTVVDNQESVMVRVTQGDEIDLAYVKDIGGTEIEIPRYPANSPIHVCFAYDIDQTVFVEVTDVTAGELVGSFPVENNETMAEPAKAEAQERIEQLEVG